MWATRLVAVACLAASPAAQGLPKKCSAYGECGDLLGDCCPNQDGVMLDCCILGAVRMSAEALEEAAKKTKKNAAEVSEEAAAAAAKAAELVKEAEKKKAEVKEANAAYEKAEHDAEQAKVAYAETSEKIKESKCENNPACDDANLKGFCCPTLDGQTLNGTMLGCCGGGGVAPANLAALPEEPPLDGPVPSAATSLASAACSAYTECGDLLGDCCPNKDGVMLSCCILSTMIANEDALEEAANKAKAAYEKAEQAAEEAKTDFAKTKKLMTEAACENNPACADAGLTGFCCPTLVGLTLNGTMLGCCSGGAGALAQLTDLPEEPPQDGLELMPFAAASIASAAAIAALVMGASRCRAEAPADGYVAAA